MKSRKLIGSLWAHTGTIGCIAFITNKWVVHSKLSHVHTICLFVCLQSNNQAKLYTTTSTNYSEVLRLALHAYPNYHNQQPIGMANIPKQGRRHVPVGPLPLIPLLGWHCVHCWVPTEWAVFWAVVLNTEYPVQWARSHSWGWCLTITSILTGQNLNFPHAVLKDTCPILHLSCRG